MLRRLAILTLLAGLAVPGMGLPGATASVGASSAPSPGPSLWADFDGDGYEDLAIGVHLEGVDGVMEAGAVNVVYGTRGGLRARGNQLWHQGLLKDEPEFGDHFGWTLAAGDFDGDGYADLAVGVPDEDLGLNGAAGAVNVVYGTGRGLRARGNQFWHQGPLKDEPEFEDRFGWTLAVGDFDGDGYDDLAVGAPEEDLVVNDHSGAVNVVYGTGRGLRARGNQFWNQGPLEDDPEAADLFGRSLAAGDFDGDGYDDLAVGVPEEDLGVESNAGAVNVVHGNRRGLRARGNQIWHQGRLKDDPETGDRFGSSLAAGDFDGDGYEDLAVGVPEEDVGGNTDAGAVNVVHGTGRGLRARGNQIWHQGRLEDESEPGDRFGSSLAAADFDGDGYADAAVGVPFEDLGANVAAGAVNVVYGTGRGLRARGNQFWNQGRLKDEPEASDLFGRAVSGRDFDGDGHADLAVGASLEDLGANVAAGAVNVVYGTGRGLRARGNQIWHQGRLEDDPESGDQFGRALA